MSRRKLAKRIGVKQPINPVVVAQAAQGVRNTVTGLDDGNPWFGPNQPMLPLQQQAEGRQFDYPVGINLQYTPRGTEAVPFEQLRALAENYDLLRILLETRKDQLVKFTWKVKPIDDRAKPDKRCEEITKFLRFPDGTHNWQTWLRMLVEDMLVIDAATIYPETTYGNDVLSLDLMDGSMIKPVLDEFGRRPRAPDVAYQQIIKGVVAANYSSDELLYMPRNVRTNKLYGYSPVEQIIMTVNIALRRQFTQLQEYTEGSVPQALASVPGTWNTKQIAEWQVYWDTLLSGNAAERKRMRFIPDGMKYYPTKDAILKDPFEEWLARICCFALSLPAHPFVKETNRATADTAKEQALEEGLHPLLTWVKDNLDYIIWFLWGYDDLEFCWDLEQELDPATASLIEISEVKIGKRSLDEVRIKAGLPAIGFGCAIYTATGATLIDDLLNPPEPPPGMVLDNTGKPTPIPLTAEDQQAHDDKAAADQQKQKAKAAVPA